MLRWTGKRDNVAVLTRDVVPPIPMFPHVRCEDGYAWHPERRKRRCWSGALDAPAEVVARVIWGPAVGRIWSLKRLLEGDRRHPPNPGALAVLFPKEAECGHPNHWHLGYMFARAARALHPGALEAIAEANPSFDEFLLLDLPAHRRRSGTRYKASGLPLRRTADETLRAQIAWALRIKAEREDAAERALKAREARRAEKASELSTLVEESLLLR
jgi:hypothetical protein